MNEREKKVFIDEILNEIKEVTEAKTELDLNTTNVAQEVKLVHVLIHVGCIECNVPSGIVGVFTDKKMALLLAEKYIRKLEWYCMGQNDFKVETIDINKLNIDTYSNMGFNIRRSNREKKEIDIIKSEIEAIEETINKLSLK